MGEMLLYVPLDGDRPWQSDVEPDDTQKEMIDKEQLQVFRFDSESGRFEGMDLNCEWDDVEFTRK